MSSEKCYLFEITTSSLCLASLLEKNSQAWSSQSSNITTTSIELQNQLFTPMVRIRNNVATTVSTCLPPSSAESCNSIMLLAHLLPRVDNKSLEDEDWLPKEPPLNWMEILYVTRIVT